MPYLVGVVLAAGVALFARVVGFDRDRAFYPTVLIVVAAYYPLYAVMGGSPRALLLETVQVAAFAAVAVAGFRGSLWVVALGLAGHGVFDAFHGLLVENPGVPEWWPAFCLAYDVVAGAGLGWILWRRPESARAVAPC